MAPFCKEKKLGCADVRNGTFHIYPANGKEHYLIIRKDTLQTETNLRAGTTSYWRVKWISNCTNTTQYISGGKIESKEQEAFYRKSTATFTILQVTKNYYVFSGSLSTPKGKMYTYTDTAWLHKK
ncbi:hypothetical protein GCM10023229_22000 [Flavisolibacter ginsenosidimutans]